MNDESKLKHLRLLNWMPIPYAILLHDIRVPRPTGTNFLSLIRMENEESVKIMN